ncbi:MAG: rod shape-determining protein [Mycoplasmatales bacterium]
MFKFGTSDIGIDLGTANILIYQKGKGIVLNQPSVVAVDTNTNKVLEVGENAYSMLGRTAANIQLIRPLKDGVIADFAITQEMLNKFLEALNIKGFFSKPKILICCPTNITTVEKAAIKDVAIRCGAKEVFVEEEPKVAAVGAGLDIFKPLGNMVIDIGGGTTDIAVLSLGGIVNSSSLKIAGDLFTQSIVDYVKREYHLLIGQRMAEEVKKTIGTILEPDKTHEYEVRGRDLITGLPKTVSLNETDVCISLTPLISEIVRETKAVLEETAPELSSDIINQGIVITGGGSLLKNLDKLLEKELSVAVYVAEDPLNSVVNGTGMLLEKMGTNSYKYEV